MRLFVFSSHKLTVRVRVDEAGIVRGDAPVIRKFIGQPVLNLARWMYEQGGFWVRPLQVDAHSPEG